MNDVLTCIPTYNEAENIAVLLEQYFSCYPTGRVLVIDDSSPDGTADIVRRLCSKYAGLELLIRKDKSGIGSAYVAGFKHALTSGINMVAQMDADGSHDMRHIQEMREHLLSGHDLVVGSRYCPGAAVENWPLRRRVLSYAANAYSTAWLRMNLYDTTGGFNLWRADTLRTVLRHEFHSRGYAFQVELKYRAIASGFSVYEMPITFRDRILAKSKMSMKVILEGLASIPRIRLWSRISTNSPRTAQI